MDHVLGVVAKGISHGIAVSSEAIAGRRDKSRSDQSQNPVDEEEELASYVDRQWAFDEVATTQQATSLAVDLPSNAFSIDAVTDSFLQSHSREFSSELEVPAPKSLPMNVIIPQRRPKDRSRGFVRAYAPMLSECDVSQDMFIDFLETFDKASRASPIFDVINIACFGVGMVPSTICLAVSASVGTASAIAEELQRRYRSNKFLDKVNEVLFMPRGLYAMVMTYQPDMPDEAFLRVDTSSADASYTALYKTLSAGGDASGLRIKQKFQRLRVSSGVATDQTIPECAPLIYPSLDLVLQSNEVSKGAGGLNFKSPVVQDYLDRRAQAKFSLENPNTKLSNALPPNSKKFVNRYADPNHPTNSGSLWGVLTGGTFDPVASSRVPRAEAKAKKNGEPPLTAEERHDAYMGRKVRGRVTGTPSKNIPIIGKMLKKDVLYLTIVNLPTQEELDRMKQELNKD